MNQEREFKKWNKEYADKFGEPISLFMTNGIPPEKIIKEIKRAIDTGKPYEYADHPQDAIF